MSKFTIVESVGNRIEPIKKYDDIEKHHPSKGKEKGRQYETLHGKLEEIAKSNGQLHVKKDFILSENGNSNVNVPSPVAGYAYYDKNYGTVAVYDKPKTDGGKLTAKLHHIKPGTLTFGNGGRVEYGQGLGQQYGTGKNGRKTYGIHSHVETDEITFRKYIDDIVSGKIIPSSAEIKKQESKRNQNKIKGSGENEIESWTLGQTSKRFESNKGGAGTISTGKGDKGGVSYGAYQLSSKEGAVQEFLKKTKYGQVFSGLEPATSGFNKKWKEIAASDSDFYAAQYSFIKDKYYEKQLDRLKKQGVDVSGRGRAVQDMVWSTATQFRNNTTSIFKNALKGQDVSKMSDAQIISAVQDYKAEKNESLFRNSSSDVRKGTLNRAKQEKEALLKLAATRPKSDAEKVNKEQEAIKQKAEQIKAQEAAKQKAEQAKAQEAAKQKAEQAKVKEAAKPKAAPVPAGGILLPEGREVASTNTGGADAAQLQAILSALQATLSQLSSVLSQPIQVTVDVQNGNIVAAVNAANSQQQRRS